MQKKIQQSQSTKEMKTLSRKLNANGLVGFPTKLFERIPKNILGRSFKLGSGFASKLNSSSINIFRHGVMYVTEGRLRNRGS